MTDVCGELMDPEFERWLSSLPKSEVRYKNEYAPAGECIRCFGPRDSLAHVRGSVGYMHPYENPSG